MARDIPTHEEMEQALMDNKAASSSGQRGRMLKADDPNESAARRDAELKTGIYTKLDALRNAPIAGSGITIFADLEVVQHRTEEYLRLCADTGTIPSVMGLATLAYGVTTSAMNQYLARHPDSPVTQYIQMTKDLFVTATLTELGLKRMVDTAMGIFQLKNQSGFADKLELAPAAPADPLGTDKSREEILQSLPQLDVYDDDGGGDA